MCRGRFTRRSTANNAEHFGGLLKQSLILLTAPASPRAEGDYVAQDVHGIPSRIRIAPRCERRGILYLSDILLHEMSHAWQAEQIGDLENGYRGHGPKFCQKANEIGARVRELRHARGMSLGELERVSGVWKGSLSLIERGRVNLTVRTCVRIARGLGVEVVDLFSEPGG